MIYCKNCGKELTDIAAICVHCGVPVGKGNNFCIKCGYTTLPTDKFCLHCGSPNQAEGKDWITTLLLNIFLGGLGVHRFYTGNIAIGVAQLLTFGGCGIWTIIDLIIILTGDYRDGNNQPLNKRNY